MKNNKRIGIFDSGLGGLTVLQSLENSFPKESFVYFGDTARVPYGNKSVETIIQYSKSGVPDVCVLEDGRPGEGKMSGRLYEQSFYRPQQC